MGCVINDFFDKDIDSKVLRTSQRPIASGKVSSIEALILFGFLSIPSVWILFQLNELSIYMGLGAALLILLYPLAKRFLAIPQTILGLAFSFGIPIAFASQNNLSLITWVIFLANFLWVIAYDTVYGMIDAADDEKFAFPSLSLVLCCCCCWPGLQYGEFALLACKRFKAGVEELFGCTLGVQACASGLMFAILLS